MSYELPCPQRENVALGPLSTFRMGGRVAVVAEPRNREEFVSTVRALRDRGRRFRVLGGGANVLIDDRGLDEAIILTTGITYMVREGDDTRVLRLGAGLSIPQFVTATRDMGLTGAECLVGIPGTIGGATVMNAGGRHGWLSRIARRVRALTAEGEEVEVAVDDETFAYRTSIFGEDRLVLETVVELAPGDRKSTSETIRSYLREKGVAQPLTQKSAGCVFKNPPGSSAGKELDAAGVKGLRAGGAAVSEKHANFIVNLGGATLNDVDRLIDTMRRAVFESRGVELETEVKIWRRER